MQQPLIIDLSHYQKINNLPLAIKSGVMGFIHKTTQGLTEVDPSFVAMRKAINAANSLFGCYHFGTGDDPVKQAEHFFNTITPLAKCEIIVLDYEPNPSGTTMNLPQAALFI